ncbi:MAG: hypothetical protein WBD55_03775 [Dehalococcoidia bacterium]
MRIRDFLELVYDRLSKRLPSQLLDHEWRVRWSLLNVWFDQPTVHYEVWVQKKNARIEIGLHFEGERDDNYRWAEVLAGRALEIQAQLGPTVELEEWTSSWTRLHETLVLDGKLNETLAAEVAGRLAAFIEVLEPIMAEERSAPVG